MRVRKYSTKEKKLRLAKKKDLKLELVCVTYGEKYIASRERRQAARKTRSRSGKEAQFRAPPTALPLGRWKKTRHT